MKKSTLYRYINIILAVVYGLSLFVQINTPLFNLPWQDYWFPTLCLFLSFSMLFKTIIFRSDSSLWLFVTLLLTSAGLMTVHILNLPLGTYWVVLLSIISVASFTVGIVFKEIYQVKAAFVVGFVSVPSYLYFFQVLSFWWCLPVLLACAFACFLLTAFMPERWYANKKKK